MKIDMKLRLLKKRYNQCWRCDHYNKKEARRSGIRVHLYRCYMVNGYYVLVYTAKPKCKGSREWTYKGALKTRIRFYSKHLEK